MVEPWEQDPVIDAPWARDPVVDAPASAASQPVPENESPGFISGAVDLVTGHNRGRGNLPEFSQVINPSGTIMGDLRIDAGFLTTPDIEARQDIIQRYIPEATFSEDEYGNAIVELPGGQRAFLNAPGMSKQDFEDLGADIVKFLPAAKWAGAAKTIGGRILRGALGGSATSVVEDAAAIPLGSQQGIQGGRALATGGLMGAVEAVAPGAVRIGRFFANRLKRLFNRQTPSVPTAPSSGLASGEPPLTQGQRTGDPRQLAREEQLRARTDEAGEIIRGFDQRQSERLREIVQEGQEYLAASGNAPLVGSEGQAGRVIAENVDESAQRLWLAIDGAFDEAAERGATVTRDGLDLLGGTRQLLEEKGFEIDPEAFPLTSKALQRLERLRSRPTVVESPVVNRQGVPFRNVEEQGITSQSLNELNTTRKYLGRLINSAANPEDRYGVVIVKKELDDFLDTVFDRALFEGDQQALSALQNARGLRAEYGRRFENRPTRTTSGREVPDEAGRLIETIVEKRATDEQIVNAIFGASDLFGKKTASSVVERLRGTVDNPEQLNSVLKQLVFRRLVRPAMRDGGFQANRFARSLNDVLEKNRSLLDTVFTGDELRALNEFKNRALQTQRTGGSMNTNEFSDKLTRLLGRLGVVFGLQKGGIGFGALGGSFGRSTGAAINKRTARRQAQQAISPTELLPGRPNNLVIATSLAGARSQQDTKDDQ